MLFQVLNEWSNDLLKEAIERTTFDISQPSPHFILRDLAT